MSDVQPDGQSWWQMVTASSMGIDSELGREEWSVRCRWVLVGSSTSPCLAPMMQPDWAKWAVERRAGGPCVVRKDDFGGWADDGRMAHGSWKDQGEVMRKKG